MFLVVSVCKSIPHGGSPGSVETRSIRTSPRHVTSLSKRALDFRLKGFPTYVPLLELHEETEVLVTSQK